MSAPLAKSDFVFRLSTTQSYIGPDYDPAPLPGVQAATRGLGRAVADRLAFVASKVGAWASRQVTLSEMGAMSDRELADIGLNRGDVPRVFDEDFVADHARGRVAY